MLAKFSLTQRSIGRLEIANEKFHPDGVIAAEGDELINKIGELTNGLGVDVVIIAAPSPEAQEIAFKLVSPRGRINFFGGLPKDNKEITIDANLIHYKEIFVSGASSSLGRQNREALDLLSRGEIDADAYITHTFSLDDIAKAFEVVERKQAIKAVVLPWA